MKLIVGSPALYCQHIWSSPVDWFMKLNGRTGNYNNKLSLFWFLFSFFEPYNEYYGYLDNLNVVEGCSYPKIALITNPLGLLIVRSKLTNMLEWVLFLWRTTLNDFNRIKSVYCFALQDLNVFCIFVITAGFFYHIRINKKKYGVSNLLNIVLCFISFNCILLLLHVYWLCTYISITWRYQ